jgi:hypothetical protein
MKTKTERKEEIKNLERKALKLLKDSSDPMRKTRNPNGLKINKMLDRVIKLENKYEKDFGINPGNYFPKPRKSRAKKTYEADVWE